MSDKIIILSGLTPIDICFNHYGFWFYAY